MLAPIRILLLADTHLGFDLPFRPRIERRRRGHDFFANFERALEPAFKGAVDLVVHGGDLLYRTKVPPALVEMALSPLVRVADTGVPVYLVPGNHERSRIPLQLWGVHSNLFIFDRPKTYTCAVRGTSIALAGFPFVRKIRHNFVDLVRETGYAALNADINLLCLHQAVEGAQVGPSDYTFRRGEDVIRGRDISGDFLAVLSGHIHRAQVLTRDLAGKKLAAPVIYPGSVERTSFAERNEDKGYQVITLHAHKPPAVVNVDISFQTLPARPMVDVHIDPVDDDEVVLARDIREKLLALDHDAIVRVHIKQPGDGRKPVKITAARLRQLAPETMNITLANTSFTRRK